nr:unnamed protein product [Callosobruchus chinensis]
MAKPHLFGSELQSVGQCPFTALKELRNLQWMNLHGNQISSTMGDWSHVKNTLATLFLGENDITEVIGDSERTSSRNQHDLHQFKSLIWLNLDGNRIYRIHKRSLPLTLQTVSVSHNLLEYFPLDIVTTLPHLQWLYLRGNHIKTLPEHTFSKKLWLEKIDLGENYLKTLPKSPFNSSVNVRDLNLAFNDFRMLTAESFSGLQTGRIIFSYNLLENIDIFAFKGIETSLEYLDFDHNNFQHVPAAVSQLRSLKYLYLSANRLADIPQAAFTSFCHSLKALSLSGNRLTRVPADALQNCTKISHFNVAHNDIQDIEREDFSDWGYNIKSLILANNRITSLKNRIFAELQELRELSLSFNPLRQIEADTFLGLDSLESLELSFGFDRGEIPFDIFKPLTRLQWLSVDHNELHSIDDNTFDSLSELRYLNVESNRLNSIPVKLLKPTLHSNLKDVRFSSNHIKVIETNTFRHLRDLETILLPYNQIRHIQKGSFSDLATLTKLILSNNLIESIANGAFVNLPNIEKLDLQNNQLSSISFGFFVNVSGPLHLNLSRNQINSCNADSKVVHMRVLDLRYNNFAQVPKCLEYTASLKKLYLDFNIINSLEHNGFMHLTSLEHLSLQQNNIMVVSRKAFFGLQNLQVLDLSKNLISQLHISQFANMPKLRILNLSENKLNHLPKDIFSDTLLEMLDLSYNLFSVVPSLSISDVGVTLRHLSICCNNIEHIDITTFPDIPFLQYLDLSNNKLTILPDNVFTSLGLLQSLDLSSNPLRANFKELFHYAQGLKYLNLANSGIASTPHLPLPNLITLNLSRNHIEAINKNSVQELGKLKVLDLSHNDLFQVPSHLWIHLPNLKTLDLSYNPIKELNAESFAGLQNLQEINLQHLKYLNRFESKSLLQLRILIKLSIQTWPKIDNFQDQFCHLLSHLDQLRILKINFLESKLDEQLLCVTNRKIRHLEITGRNLRAVDRDAFARLTRNPDLMLKIHGTQISELPSGIFANMHKISYLTLDLRHNMLTYLSPEVFYGNYSMQKNTETSLISGGLYISGNPFRCGCHLLWLGHWLRRWSREALHSHRAPADAAPRVHEAVRRPRCRDRHGRQVPIVDLPPEDVACQASALSAARIKSAGFEKMLILIALRTIYTVIVLN